MTNTMRRVALIGLLGMALVPISVQAQSPGSTRTAPALTPAPTAGRFQLMPLAEGTYLVDTALGRVWRLMILSPDPATMKRYVDTRLKIAYEQTVGPDKLTVVPLSAEQVKKLTVESEQEYQTAINPCRGTTSCFVELDRESLLSTGAWASDVVTKQ